MLHGLFNAILMLAPGVQAPVPPLQHGSAHTVESKKSTAFHSKLK